jgi:glucose 1-dehydrogenase
MRQIDAVDILVLNASIQIKKPFENITRDEFELQMNANVWSAVRLINFYRPAMKAKGWGRVLFLGSVQQVKPHPQMAIYAATKSSVGNLMINLAAQFAPDHITVNSIAPGVILTGRNTQALSDTEYADVVRKKIPMGDFGQPEDCAALALILCTEAGRYITGQNIYCDGGMSLRIINDEN